MKTGTALIVGLVVGAAAGALGMHLAFDEERALDDRVVVQDAAPTEALEPMLEGTAPPADETTRAPVAEGDVHMTREAYLQAYREMFREMTGTNPSAEQEAAAWEQFGLVTTQAPLGMANRAASLVLADRQRAEISDRDDIMALLEDKERKDDVQALRNDPGALQKLLSHKIQGAQLNGPEIAATRSEEPVPDGTVLYFPDGVHSMGPGNLIGRGRQSRMPRDLTIEGAGIDRTLIRWSDFSVNDYVYNLHLEDCTIDCGNDGAFDLRHKKASVYAENVRFVRFDAGHGGCQVFDFRGGALYCLACRFEGGYGSSPGNGNILRHVDVVRFEGCVFERINYTISSHERAYFARCEFRDCRRMEAVLADSLKNPAHHKARFDACVVETTLVLDPESGRVDLKRDLVDLFPVLKR